MFKKLKKPISLLLAVVALFTLLPVSAIASFDDSVTHWAAEAIDRWSEEKVVNGYPDGSFRPDDNITRAEMATILSNLLLLNDKAENSFTDVPNGLWYEVAMLKCVAAGIIKGDGIGLKPDDLITREEAIVMIARALKVGEATNGAEKYSDKSDISDWALGFINAMTAQGYIQGSNGKIEPKKSIKRAEVVTILNNAIDYYISNPGTYDISGDGIAIVAANGVSLNKSAFSGTLIETELSKADAKTVVSDDINTFVGVLNDNGTVTYRGIKYAEFEPWQASEMITNYGVYYADTYGPGSTQGDPDCLTVNVYVNPNYSGKRHVYMYQYGCGQRGGSNATQDWTKFVAENPDIIVVTPNHRGGFFGSLDLSVLDGWTEDYKYSNNLARIDLLNVLKWINTNIETFGGDRNDVTIGGHSSGSNNVTCLLMMEQARPYFQKAICQASFSIDISLETLETAKFISSDLFASLSVTTVDELLALSREEVFAAQQVIYSRSASGSSAYANVENKMYSPVIDNVVIFDDCYQQLLDGACADKTVIFGSNAGEYDQQYVDKEGNPLSAEDALAFTIEQNWGKLSDRGWNKDNAQAVIDEIFSHNSEYGRDAWTAAKDLKNDLYLRCGAIMFAEALSRYTDVYFYHLDWDITPENNLRASHGSENNIIQRLWNSVPENMLSGAEMISTTWATFIRTGNPNNELLPEKWELYNGDTHNTMYIAPDTKDSHMVNGWRQKDVDTLLPLFREYSALLAAKEKRSEPGEYNGYTVPTYNGYNRHSIYVPVDDGTKLAVDVYIPTINGTEATEALPAIMYFTRNARVSYNSDGSIRENSDAAFFTKYGYVFVMLQARGTGASFGTRIASNDTREAKDGGFIADWIVQQDWCNGKLGTMGSSYHGQTQLETLANTKSVSASCIGVTDFNKYDGWVRGGVPRAFGSYPDIIWGDTEEEINATIQSQIKNTVPVDDDPDKTMLAEAIKQHVANGLQVPMFQQLLWRNSYWADTDSEYWNEVSASTNMEKIENSGSAIYVFGGLYDVFRRDSIITYNNLSNAHKLILGPWYHTKAKTEINWNVEHLRWFDYWLKGIDNGIMDEDPIYIKTVNDTENNGYSWHTEWNPSTGTRDTLYLNSGNLNSSKVSTESYDKYTAVYGIKDSVESANVADLVEKGLVFQTDVLKSDYEITGHSMVHLNFSLEDPGYMTDNYDIDFFVTFADYDPVTGESFEFSDGHLRASLRETATCTDYDYLGLPWHPCNEENISYLNIGTKYELLIDMMPTSYIVPEGHQLQVIISNSLDRMYYLGRYEYEADENVKTPTVNIYTGGEYASYIELPNIYAK